MKQQAINTLRPLKRAWVAVFPDSSSFVSAVCLPVMRLTEAFFKVMQVARVKQAKLPQSLKCSIVVSSGTSKPELVFIVQIN